MVYGITGKVMARVRVMEVLVLAVVLAAVECSLDHSFMQVLYYYYLNGVINLKMHIFATF